MENINIAVCKRTYISQVLREALASSGRESRRWSLVKVTRCTDCEKFTLKLSKQQERTENSMLVAVVQHLSATNDDQGNQSGRTRNFRQQ